MNPFPYGMGLIGQHSFPFLELVGPVLLWSMTCLAAYLLVRKNDIFLWQAAPLSLLGKFGKRQKELSLQMPLSLKTD